MVAEPAAQTFTLSVLQRLDSLSGGKLMDKTFLITGASGGMLGAAYYRELARERSSGKNLYLYSQKYVDDISKDLLNPTFSSFVARDMASPAQKFSIGNYSYIKDRGYAFEEKLRENTRDLLNRQLKDIAADEHAAKTPLMMFNAVIARDGRKMVISTQPVSFLMKPQFDSGSLAQPEPDEIDFAALFAKQDPMNLRLLTALRMNATFPYVLPNVWLPSKPVIDVMDAGLRDNYGPRNSTSFRGCVQRLADGKYGRCSDAAAARPYQPAAGTTPLNRAISLNWLPNPCCCCSTTGIKCRSITRTIVLVSPGKS